MAIMHYDKDCASKALAVIGYGSRGRAHALIKDSGHKVIVGLYEGSESWKEAESKGFNPMTAADAEIAGEGSLLLTLVSSPPRSPWPSSVFSMFASPLDRLEVESAA